jgi:hypothetical protein
MTLQLVWSAPTTEPARPRCASIGEGAARCPNAATYAARGFALCGGCRWTLTTRDLTVAHATQTNTIDGAPMLVGLGQGTPCGALSAEERRQ